MTRDDQQFALCVRNDDYAASLEPRKIYHVIPDTEAERRGLVRVVDESGEDYLYPRDFFVPVEIPEAATELFLQAS